MADSGWDWCAIHGDVYSMEDDGCNSCMEEWEELEEGDRRIPGNETPEEE